MDNPNGPIWIRLVLEAGSPQRFLGFSLSPSPSLSLPPSLPPFMKGFMGWVAFENAGPYPGQPLPTLPQTCYARVCPFSLIRLVWATLVSITCLGFLLLDWKNSLDNLFWLNRARAFYQLIQALPYIKRAKD